MENPDQQRQLDYEHAIGPNRHYYLERFERFDAGGPKASWHWPAFFVTAPWFIYRRMWASGLLSLFLPLLALIVLCIVLALLKPPVALWVVACLACLLLPSVVLATFANSMYWRHINRLIRNLPSNVAQDPQFRQSILSQKGGTGVMGMIAVLAGFGFGGIVGLGILAAIAIPAYQDYTIRAQTSEGLRLAAPLKVAVAEYYAENEQWPNQEDLGGNIRSGQFVTGVTVEEGSVVISYGNKAHPRIAGQRVALLPGLNDEGEMIWACGYAGFPEGVTSAEGPSGSEVDARYLPSACRAPAAGDRQ